MDVKTSSKIPFKGIWRGREMNGPVHQLAGAVAGIAISAYDHEDKTGIFITR